MTISEKFKPLISTFSEIFKLYIFTFSEIFKTCISTISEIFTSSTCKNKKEILHKSKNIFLFHIL